MEFFEWMVNPLQFLYYFSFSSEVTLENAIAYVIKYVTILFWVAVGLYLLGHVFGGFGLYKMAKNRGDKLAWMAFFPVLNTYLSGRLAGEANIFGIKCKRIGLYAAIIEFIYIAISIFTLTLSLLMLNGNFLGFVDSEVDGTIIRGLDIKATQAIPMAYRWMVTALDVMNIIGIVWYILTLASFIFLYMAFFRKYYARSPMVMAFLCSIFPVRGYVIFAVRNNTPVDYNAWMQERIRRMQQQQYGYPPYGGPQQPYGGPQQPYGGPQQPYGGAPQGEQGEPFSDFGDAPSAPPSNGDDPFSDL